LSQVSPSTMRKAGGSKSGTFKPPARETPRTEVDDVSVACRALFDAYDVDESGELDRQEFIQIEMRLAFDKGQDVREAPLTAGFTLADRDNSGQLSFDEFRDQQMRNFSEAQLTKQEILKLLTDETRACILERQRMGPRYHTGIRAELRRIFQLYDTSGDASLSPQEWIAAQKIVAVELSDDVDDSWINEGAFSLADTNGDGKLSEAEYLEASFSMFEVTRMNMAQLMVMLKNITTALEKKLGTTSTQALKIWMQDKESPEFLPPSRAWQDEPTSSAAGQTSNAWKEVGEIKFPTNLATAEEVISLTRLSCDIPKETWLSIYYLSPNPEGSHLVTLLRDSNTKTALDYLAKQNAQTRLYVKNVRPKPKRLTKQSLAYLEDRESLLAKRTGNCWGIDWETQLVGAGSKYPRAGEVPIAVGDAVVIEIPTTDDHGEFSYVPSIYMDGIEVVSRPVEETIEPKAKKKKKKKGAVEEEEKPPDLLKQLSFIGLQEGKCVMFVDISWEDQESVLCQSHSLGAPVKENCIARIGPIEVDVQKPVPGAPKEKTFMWWNGDKWSNKKGPAKKKGKK